MHYVKLRKIYREPTLKGRKPGLKLMVWNRRKKETFNQNRNKNSKKMRRGSGTSRTTLNIPTSDSYGCQKKRKSKKLKTYLKK